MGQSLSKIEKGNLLLGTRFQQATGG